MSRSVKKRPPNFEDVDNRDDEWYMNKLHDESLKSTASYLIEKIPELVSTDGSSGLTKYWKKIFIGFCHDFMTAKRPKHRFCRLDFTSNMIGIMVSVSYKELKSKCGDMMNDLDIKERWKGRTDGIGILIHPNTEPTKVYKILKCCYDLFLQYHT